MIEECFYKNTPRGNILLTGRSVKPFQNIRCIDIVTENTKQIPNIVVSLLIKINTISLIVECIGTVIVSYNYYVLNSKFYTTFESMSHLSILEILTKQKKKMNIQTTRKMVVFEIRFSIPKYSKRKNAKVSTMV